MKKEKKILIKSCVDGYSSNKQKSSKKRTISSENVTYKNIRSVQAVYVKVDLHNISTKYDTNAPFPKMNYFDDNNQTTLKIQKMIF